MRERDTIGPAGRKYGLGLADAEPSTDRVLKAGRCVDKRLSAQIPPFHCAKLILIK